LTEKPKCPACRKRFVLDDPERICTRCGADLSLLIRLRQQSQLKIIRTFTNKELQPCERIRKLKSAQQLCRLKPLIPLIDL